MSIRVIPDPGQCLSKLHRTNKWLGQRLALGLPTAIDPAAAPVPVTPSGGTALVLPFVCATPEYMCLVYVHHAGNQPTSEMNIRQILTGT